MCFFIRPYLLSINDLSYCLCVTFVVYKKLIFHIFLLLPSLLGAVCCFPIVKNTFIKSFHSHTQTIYAGRRDNVLAFSFVTNMSFYK